MSNKLPHDRDHLLDWDSIVDRRHTKAALARHHFPPEQFTWDCALPQSWLNQVSNEAEDLEYSTLLFSVIWLYPGKSESPTYCSSCSVRRRWNS